MYKYLLDVQQLFVPECLILKVPIKQSETQTTLLLVTKHSMNRVETRVILHNPTIHGIDNGDPRG